jgi:hypothetical protein
MKINVFSVFFFAFYETIVAVEKKEEAESKHKRMQKQKDEGLITIKGCLDATF